MVLAWYQSHGASGHEGCFAVISFSADVSFNKATAALPLMKPPELDTGQGNDLGQDGAVYLCRKWANRLPVRISAYAIDKQASSVAVPHLRS